MATTSTDGTAKDTPLVSVVMPTFNAGRFIGEALESVFSQDYPRLEVIVVDDGSTDDTEQVVGRYGNAVRYIRQTNSGSAVARNTGMSEARGEFIAFLDSDDVWLPGKVRNQVEYLLRKSDVGICCSKWELMIEDEQGKFPWPHIPEANSISTDPALNGWIYCDLLLDCLVWTSTVMIRSDLARRIGGFDPTLRRGQDYDYWLRASQECQIDRLDAPMAVYRIERDAHGRKHPGINWELRVISNALDRWGVRHPGKRELPRNVLRQRLWSLNYRFAYTQYRDGAFGTAADAFDQAMRHRPTHIRTWIYLAMARFRARTTGSGSA